MTVALWILFTLLNFSYAFNFDASKTLNNPLRGFSAYCCGTQNFPHTLENFYIPMRSVMTGVDSYDWRFIEDKLVGIGNRGHHAIFRIFLDYPGSESGRTAIPDFLFSAGLTTTPYNDQTGKGEIPNYSFEPLVSAMERLIAALGTKYDGDARIGFIQIGLFGKWGEWHNWPLNDNFPNAVQARILRKFDASFSRTRIMVRYPHKTGGIPGTDLDIGFFDDSFAEASIGTTDWHFKSLLTSSGNTERWKKVPIGGEVYPSLMPCIFSSGCAPQDFKQCVRELHTSWVWNNAINSYTGTTAENAKNALSEMGYQYFVSAVTFRTVSAGNTEVSVTVQNKGVAPFYYPLALKVESATLTNTLNDLMPGTSAVYKATVPTKSTLRLYMTSWIVRSNQKISFANTQAGSDGSIMLTVSTVPTTSANTYLGCFKDFSASRILTTFKTTDASNSRDWCAAQCAGFIYSGVQYGNECWCSQTFTNRQSSSDCTTSCPGQTSQKCGGYWAIDVTSLNSLYNADDSEGVDEGSTQPTSISSVSEGDRDPTVPGWSIALLVLCSIIIVVLLGLVVFGVMTKSNKAESF